MTLLDESVHRRPVRALDREDLAAGVGVRVEVDEADARGDRAHVRLRDRVVAAEHDRHRAGVDDLADDILDRSMRPLGIGRQHRRVAEVDDPQLGEGVDARLQVRPGRAARRSDRARRKPGPRPVGDEIIRRRTHDCDVGAAQLDGVLGVRGAAERE